jgi:hypothetical protein
LSTFTFLATLFGVALGPLLFSAARTFATRSLRSDYTLNVHAPIGANPSLGLFPLHSDQIVIGAAIAAVAIAVVTIALIAFYPSSQTLANRLGLYTIGTAVLATGSIAAVADLGILRSISRWRELPEPASGGILAAWGILVLLAVVWLERQTISLLGNVFEIDNPVRRLALWALRLPLPWIAFAALCVWSDWWGGAIAAGGVLLATLLDDLVHYPSLRYESLERPRMHEGLAAVLILALITTAGSVWAFGLPAAKRPAQAVVWDDGRISLVPVSELTFRIQEETMPRIEMKWSNEK